MASLSSYEAADHLFLSSNGTVRKMLLKHGDRGRLEHIVFSDFVTKINKRGKEQTRVLLITDFAIYNLLDNNYGKCKRRIALESLTAITISNVSFEFVLHIPDEYDYRYKSEKKKQVVEILAFLFSQLHHNASRKLPVLYASQSNLKDCAFTKPMAKLQTREDIMRRKYLLAREEHDSDKEEEGDIQRAAQDKTNLENVSPLIDRVSSGQTFLDDFDLLKVLGRGSFGKVMQIRHKRSGEIYAMKILKKSAIVARDQVAHTIAERKILQTLSHPFLVKLHFAFQTTEKLYFVLDYYQGGELFFHLRQQRRFSEDTARLYVAELASAIGHLHKKGIIFRDLKPENILLDANGHVCLTDFGLSKEITTQKAQTFCGTPEYLAPEIVTNTGHDKAVDWWSLGILLYELTVGIPPFYSQNVNEMYHKIQFGVLRFPPFLTDFCKSAIIGLLNRDPKKRMGSMNDVEDIKAHPFFSMLSWEKLLRKDYDIPFKPRIITDDDTSNFDEIFTNEPIIDSTTMPCQFEENVANINYAEDAFRDFSFVAR